MTLAVLGATGFTGRLVLDEARRASVPVRLVGRRREALEELARGGEEVRVADARDREALAAAFDGTFAVVSLAGPFLAVGFAPVGAAIDAGAHYVDTTGEQEFARRVYDEWGPRAADRGVVLLTAFGFDYVPGDVAARLAGEGLEPVEEIAVAYSVTAMRTSRGTRRTVASGLGRPHLAYERGERVPSRFGATTRHVRFPFGERTVLEWPGTEPLTVPRHTDVRTVRSYFRAPAAAGKASAAGRLLGPLARLGARFGPAGPAPESRGRARFAVVAEATGAAGSRRPRRSTSTPSCRASSPGCAWSRSSRSSGVRSVRPPP